MALITSAASGNFSAGATWTGGVVPGVGDEAQAANGHTITIDVDTTCDEISNAGTGIFTLADGVTLTANVTQKSTTANRNCLQFTAASPAAATIVGNCTGGSVGISAAAINTSSGTLTITGNCTGGSGNTASGANSTSTGTVIITGNCTGGSGNTAYGANNNSTGTLTITGDCTGGSGGTTNANGAYGANNNSTGTLTVVGTISASEFQPGVSGGNRGQTTLLTGPFISSSTFGVNPIGNLAWRWAASLNDQTYITVPTSDLLATRNLVTPDNATNFPSASDVRSAVTYGIGGALTGTCAVPAAASVGFGVPVDNTTGTAALTPASVWDHLLSAITTSDTIGALLKTNIDATISSRSTATTAGIADAVWDEILNGSTHNVAGSAGRRLRILDEERIIADGQVQSATTNTVTLEPIGTLCVGQTIVVTDPATNDKQTRFILSFDPGTYTATVDSNWCTVPTAGDEYLLTTVRDPLVTRADHPAGTVGAEIDEMYLLQGLKTGSDLTVTPTSRTAGAVSQTISGDGTTTTTVSRD